MEHNTQIKTARITGFWYLMLAISGVFGFMVFNSQVYIADDYQKTLNNLVEHTGIARLRLLFECIIIASQAMAAIYFYKLFAPLNKPLALGIGIWGTVNAMIIMISAVAIQSSIDFALSGQLSDTEKLSLIALCMTFMSNAWSLGGIFFGLWLLPMGYVVIKTKSMPVWLGRVLVLGGFSYLVQTVLSVMGVEGDILNIIPIPATIGELWMIGYLFIYGIKTNEESNA